MVKILTLKVCAKCNQTYIVYGEDAPDGNNCPKCEEEENTPKK
jgi:hypothetical protein